MNLLGSYVYISTLDPFGKELRRVGTCVGLEGMIIEDIQLDS